MLGLNDLVALGGAGKTSLSLAELVLLLTVTLAVLTSVVGVLGVPTVPVTVKVKVLLIGMVGNVMPAPCMAATVELAGQVEPPPAVQLTLLTLRLLIAGDVNTALLSGLPVVLVMTMV